MADFQAKKLYIYINILIRKTQSLGLPGTLKMQQNQNTGIDRHYANNPYINQQLTNSAPLGSSQGLMIAPGFYGGADSSQGMIQGQSTQRVPIQTVPSIEMVKPSNPPAAPNTTEYVPDHEEYHINVGEYLKSAVYGGTDGVINSLAVIIGGIASGTLPFAIFAIGISVVVGDGIGMGLGDYLSAKAEKQYILSEEKRQYWEIQNKLQDQKNQIIAIYKQKNYSDQHSKRLAQLFATNDEAFVNVMMLQQLGLVVDDSNPIINGIVNTTSFMIHGFLPLIPYLAGKIRGDNQTQYIWAIAIGGFQLLSLGFAKSTLIGASYGRRVWSAFETLLFASIAVAAGYGIGKIFQGRE